MSTAAPVLERPTRDDVRGRPWLANRSEQVVRDSHPAPGTICISITDPYRPASDSMPRLYGYEAVLRIRFCDLDPASKARERLHRARCHDREGYHMLTPEQAQTIADFANRHRGLSMMVHCAAGISRSAAVAKALLEAYPEYEDRMWPGQPNLHVLSLMRRALGLTQPIEEVELEGESNV